MAPACSARSSSASRRAATPELQTCTAIGRARNTYLFAGNGMAAEHLRLYSYWRSSAAYRVRIGLNLKSLPYETVPVHLVRDGGEQHSAAFKRVNPQELVPVLQHGDRV